MDRPTKFFFLASILIGSGLLYSFAVKENPSQTIKVSSFGKQPVIAVDDSNRIHIVFGKANEIFYTRSTNAGLSFSDPKKVGEQQKLALGATRGPQIVSTRDFLVIAAADHTGKIMTYRLKHGESNWSDPVNILKSDSTAKEGFIAIAAGRENHVYAAWLDLRIGNQNNIFSAYSADGGKTWSDSKLVYASPQGGICPCCRPSISADSKGNVYVMFRNELEGARDLYMAHSKDGGRSFSSAQKLGTGTWMLDRCPMDGGSISMDARGNVATAWRRENFVYYSEPGKPEIRIGEGKSASLVKNSKGNYFAWEKGNSILCLSPDKLEAEIIGSGMYPRLANLRDESVICIWEWEGQIFAKKLSGI